MSEHAWNADRVGEETGLSPKTIRYYRKVGARERREGTATARTIPAPRLVDGENVWDPDEIRAWVAARKSPARRGAIPKSEMRAVLAAAENHNIDQVITIARRNLA